MTWNFSFTTFRYLFFELLPSFIMGNMVFIFIVLMFQGLKFAEFALIHGIGGRTLLEILFYMTISLLPAILPMSLLFSVVLTFGRLSGDSEIVALKASGLSLTQMMIPVLILGAMTSFASAQLAFDIAPWGNRKFEVLISQLSNTKAAINLKEGTFMEGFFDMVVYASKVHPESGELDHVFIYDERQNPPITIIAKKGFMSQNAQVTGQQVQLELREGDIHRKTGTHTKINFGKFFISLNENYRIKEKDKTLQSMTLDELRTAFKDQQAEPKVLRSYEVEYHRRIAISFACVIFALLGSGLGINTQKRSGRGSGLVVALSVIVVYWVLFVSFESAARASKHPAYFFLWLPNVFFLIATFRTLKKQST
jgi:lipopolysaccharide export system permease protein